MKTITSEDEFVEMLKYFSYLYPLRTEKEAEIPTQTVWGRPLQIVVSKRLWIREKLRKKKIPIEDYFHPTEAVRRIVDAGERILPLVRENIRHKFSELLKHAGKLKYVYVRADERCEDLIREAERVREENERIVREARNVVVLELIRKEL